MIRVLFLSSRCCPRVFKQGRELIKAGFNVFFMQQFVPLAIKTILPNQFYWQNTDDLGAKIKALKPDLIHAHYEPAWIGHFAKAQLPDTPVVYDCHDSDYMRHSKDTEDERKSHCDCDGVIYPSYTYQRELVERYGVELSEVIYSMVNKEDFPEYPLARVNGIVYEGGVTVTDPADRAVGRVNINDYRSLSVKLNNAGIPLHLYAATEKTNMSEYVAAGAVWHPGYTIQTLLHQLTRYDWGLVGSPVKNTKQWDAAMPNKLFEYIAAGIPVLVYNAKEAAKFVREYKFGAVIEADNSKDAVIEIKSCYHLHKYYRKQVQDRRKHITMASQTPKLINFYTEVMKKCPKSRSSTGTREAAKPALVSAAI